MPFPYSPQVEISVLQLSLMKIPPHTTKEHFVFDFKMKFPSDFLSAVLQIILLHV